MAELNGLPHRRSTPTRYGWLLGAFATLVVLSAALSFAPTARAPIVDLLEHLLVRGTSGKYAKLQFSLYDTMYPKSVAWSPDGKYIATEDRDVHIWNVQQRKIIKILPMRFPVPWFHELAFSPDGKYLAACGGAGVLHVYDTGSWAVAHVFSELRMHGGCDHPVFSSDSQQIAAGLGYLTVISVPDWRIIKHLVLGGAQWRGDLFKALAYLPNTHTVLVGGGQYITIMLNGKKQGDWAGRVWFFGPEDQIPSRTIQVYDPSSDDRWGAGSVLVLTTSPNGRYLVTGAKTGAGNKSMGFITKSVHVLRTSDGSLVAAPLDGLSSSKFPGGEAIAYTHDGHYIIVPHDSVDGWIHVLDGRTFKVLDLVRSNAFTFDVAVNAVNDDFAVGTGRKVMVWSLPAR